MSIWELINVSNKVADLGEGPPYFELKKEEITEERKAGRASKTTPPLRSRSGSATAHNIKR